VLLYLNKKLINLLKNYFSIKIETSLELKNQPATKKPAWNQETSLQLRN